MRLNTALSIITSTLNGSIIIAQSPLATIPTPQPSPIDIMTQFPTETTPNPTTPEPTLSLPVISPSTNPPFESNTPSNLSMSMDYTSPFKTKAPTFMSMSMDLLPCLDFGNGRSKARKGCGKSKSGKGSNSSPIIQGYGYGDESYGDDASMYVDDYSANTGAFHNANRHSATSKSGKSSSKSGKGSKRSGSKSNKSQGTSNASNYHNTDSYGYGNGESGNGDYSLSYDYNYSENIRRLRRSYVDSDMMLHAEEAGFELYGGQRHLGKSGKGSKSSGGKSGKSQGTSNVSNYHGDNPYGYGYGESVRDDDFRNTYYSLSYDYNYSENVRLLRQNAAEPEMIFLKGETSFELYDGQMPADLPPLLPEDSHADHEDDGDVVDSDSGNIIDSDSSYIDASIPEDDSLFEDGSMETKYTLAVNAGVDVNLNSNGNGHINDTSFRGDTPTTLSQSR